MYTIRKTENKPQLDGNWESPIWQQAETLQITNWRPESSEHHPVTKARLLYDNQMLYGIFKVEDQYVRCVRTEFQSSVCRDSCVEFFVQPKVDKGYFNFEMNCGGTLLVYYVTDSRREDDSIRERVELTPEEGEAVEIYHSLPKTVDPEIQEPTQWVLQFHIPRTVFETYVGEIGDFSGQEWRANFYKCADETSHPHWGSWQPVDKLNFHLPNCFGPILFGL